MRRPKGILDAMQQLDHYISRLEHIAGGKLIWQSRPLRGDEPFDEAEDFGDFPEKADPNKRYVLSVVELEKEGE